MRAYRPPWSEYEQIAAVAAGFLSEHHPSGAIPIPLEEIVEFELSIEVVPTKGLRERTGIEGWLTRDGKEFWVDEDVMTRFPQRYIFTLAHELGHWVLHQSYVADIAAASATVHQAIDALDDQAYARVEYQANCFAGLVLVPSPQLDEVIQRSVGRLLDKGYEGNLEPYAEYVARLVAGDFEVSPDVVLRRMQLGKLWPPCPS